MKEEKKWRVTLNDDQLKLINRALEFYFRTILGQGNYMADEIVDEHYYPFDRSADNYKKRFDAYLRDRDVISEIFRAVFRILYGAYGVPERQSDNIMAMEDMWSVIRHAMWLDRPEPKPHDTVDASGPYIRPGNAPIKVERIIDGET